MPKVDNPPGVSSNGKQEAFWKEAPRYKHVALDLAIAPADRRLFFAQSLHTRRVGKHFASAREEGCSAFCSVCVFGTSFLSGRKNRAGKALLGSHWSPAGEVPSNTLLDNLFPGHALGHAWRVVVTFEG